MSESVEDGTEGGYTAYPEIPEEELQKMREQRPKFFEKELDPADFPDGYLEALADKYGKDCPNPDCICKKGD